MKITLSIIAGVVVLIGGYAIYLGALHEVKIERTTQGPFPVIFKPLRGEYRQVGEVATALSPRLDRLGIKEQTFIGIYYDNPRSVPTEQLRSEAGFIVPGVTELPAALKGEYHFKVVQANEYASAYFPYRNMLSVFMGIFKVYPKLSEHMRAQGIERTYGVEIYRPNNEDRVLYMIAFQAKETYLDQARAVSGR